MQRLNNLQTGDIIEFNDGMQYIEITRIDDSGLVYYKGAAEAPYSSQEVYPEYVWQHIRNLAKPSYTVGNPTYRVTRIVGQSFLRDRYNSLA